ncbi:right-handed parallel beta-helix repeat-containing protein [Kitasatospora sp. NPDC093679]|uniref:right-handed parallel beta-helix repeat-containing protein n=1 Tax=Kitasatospora sp. NPDC093679 TaxID=3154983 RepID=UPI00341C39C3
MAAAVGAAVLGAVGLPAVASGGAAAEGATLYVNNAPGSYCSDSGNGTQAVPFCQVSAAAAVVEPGQTVEIARGDYNGNVVLTRSGTAEAPITFHSAAGAARLKAPGSPGHGLVVQGARHLRIEGLSVEANQQQAVLVDGASDVTFMGVPTWMGGVRITNGSSNVVYGRSSFAFKSGPTVLVDGGSTGTVVTTNRIFASNLEDMTGVLVNDAPNTVVVANTVIARCSPGIVLNGASGGATVENNVVDTSTSYQACASHARDTGITVAQTATAGTKVDYNVVSPLSGGAAYNWAGTAYTDRQAFTDASSQGIHDFVADPSSSWRSDPKGAPSPIIDSADENAPGMLTTDGPGRPILDDPVISNTGTGSSYRDRGWMEFADFGSVFTPAGPTRLLDTREKVGVPTTTAVAPGATVDLQVAGVAGIPASGVTAVTMNVTVTDTAKPGFLTVYPHGDEMPNASNINWVAGQTIPNLVTVPVKDGKVSFRNSSGGTAHIVADLAGYYGTKGSVFTAAGPTRLLDTRSKIGVPTTTAVAAGGDVALQVAGVAGVPASGVTAVTMNVTVTDTAKPGFLTVYPHGDAVPNASNLNWTAGRTIPNLVTVPVKDGKVSFHNSSGGTVHIVADLAGYYGAKGLDTYRPLGPWRAMDTRQNWGGGEGPARPAGAVAAKGTLDLAVNVPNATAVTLNVTVTEPGGPGFLTVYPNGAARPNASNLNWVAGQTIANQVVVPVKNGKVSFYNASGYPVHVVVDVFGYQAP